MDLCIDEKDEERESEAESTVKGEEACAPPPPLPADPFHALFFALTADCASLSRSSSFSSMQRSIAISRSMFCAAIGRFVQRLFVVFVCDPAQGLFLEIDGLLFLLDPARGLFCKTANFSTFVKSHEHFVCSKLSLVSMLELVVLKNLIQRTSQRVK